MKIFVPKYLRKLGVLGNLCNAISEYSSKYEPIGDGSFSDYQLFLKIDPVKRFINLCLSEKTDLIEKGTCSIYNNPDSITYVGKEEPDPDVILNYLTRLFYSIRGTYDVFTYMSSYLGLEFEGNPVYTSESVSFTLKKTVGDDLAIFEESLNNFLNALLYFGKLEYSIENADLIIQINSNINGAFDIRTYKRFELDAKGI